MGLWAQSVRMFNSIRENGQQSIRRLAERTGLSKSSVHRHLQAIDRRDRYPESRLWETPEGRNWLIRLIVATLLMFGLKRGVGAETMSEFFGRLHLEAHLGCSPSALRSLMRRLEQTILATAAAWERQGIAHGEIRPIIGAVDETFLQRLMLVFMDLASGYLLVEEVAVDRTYDTWHCLVKARLKTFGVDVSYLVSDRAKALIKLAETGLDCRDCLTTQLFELTVFSLIPWGPSGAMSTNQRWAVSAQVTHRDKLLCASHGERYDNSNTAV
jgi:hypothetical protein